MSLKQRLTDDMKTAMKAQDKVRLGVVRMLLSEIKYAQAATSIRDELGDDEALKVVTGYHKKLEKSLADFPEGAAKDSIRSEMKIIEDYLPKKLSAADVGQTVDAVLAMTTDRQFGPLMKQVMTKLGAGADGKIVSEILKQKLQ